MIEVHVVNLVLGLALAVVAGAGLGYLFGYEDCEKDYGRGRR